MREQFLEMLSSMTSHEITLDRFVVSPAQAVTGVITQVDITPTTQSNIYGARHMQYKRFDLATVPPVAMAHQGEQFVHELVTRLYAKTLFKYRLKDRQHPLVNVPRFLKLTPQDIVDTTLPTLIIANTVIVLQAHPESDFFVGSLTVLLNP